MPAVYEFRVEGTLDPSWSEWFSGLEISQETEQTTRLIGLVPDQAALHGILNKIRDLRLNLISLNLISPKN